MADEPVKMNLLTCPFCGRTPEAQRWHGGADTKVMITCPAEFEGECVAPSVTGETPAEAAEIWNRSRERNWRNGIEVAP